MSAEIQLNEIIKSLAINAFNESKPTNLTFGKVENVNPLKIRVNQKLLLTKEFLVLSENVKKYKTFISIKDYSGVASIDNSLKVGDKVAMIRLNGGQIYYIVGRVD